MKGRKNDSSSGDDGKEPKDRRETILQRRDRVLGTKSLRYVHNAEKGWQYSFPTLKLPN
jgi:hypothetical protein